MNTLERFVNYKGKLYWIAYDGRVDVRVEGSGPRVMRNPTPSSWRSIAKDGPTARAVRAVRDAARDGSAS